MDININLNVKLFSQGNSQPHSSSPYLSDLYPRNATGQKVTQYAHSLTSSYIWTHQPSNCPPTGGDPGSGQMLRQRESVSLVEEFFNKNNNQLEEVSDLDTEALEEILANSTYSTDDLNMQKILQNASYNMTSVNSGQACKHTGHIAEAQASIAKTQQNPHHIQHQQLQQKMNMRTMSRGPGNLSVITHQSTEVSQVQQCESISHRSTSSVNSGSNLRTPDMCGSPMVNQRVSSFQQDCGNYSLNQQSKPVSSIPLECVTALNNQICHVSNTSSMMSNNIPQQLSPTNSSISGNSPQLPVMVEQCHSAIKQEPGTEKSDCCLHLSPPCMGEMKMAEENDIIKTEPLMMEYETYPLPQEDTNQYPRKPPSYRDAVAHYQPPKAYTNVSSSPPLRPTTQHLSYNNPHSIHQPTYSTTAVSSLNNYPPTPPDSQPSSPSDPSPGATIVAPGMIVNPNHLEQPTPLDDVTPDVPLTPVTQRPRQTHPGCTTIKYNRKNNPDLEKRRIHFCDFRG